MTFEKAIEVLAREKEPESVAEVEELIAAIKLGKEALEFLKRWRDKAEIQPYPLLPSETVG